MGGKRTVRTKKECEEGLVEWRKTELCYCYDRKEAACIEDVLELEKQGRMVSQWRLRNILGTLPLV